MNKNTKLDKLGKLNTVFTPSAAITMQDLFSGRKEQLDRVLDAISEKGQHVVLYGERGVGKTSLANVVNLILQNQPDGKISCARVSCDPTESFGEIWRRTFKKISVVLTKPGLGFVENTKVESVNLDRLLPLEEVKPSDVVSILEQLHGLIFFIFDEFDTIKATDTKTKFAYTIKALSDSLPHVTILIVGVAENVNSLIGEHQSLERCIKQIFLQRMSEEELGAIVDKGLGFLCMGIEESVKKDIISFSQGFPQYTHLLTKYAAKTAIELDVEKIERSHFNVAVDEAIENAQETIRNCYEKAININRPSHVSYKEIVSACAIAEAQRPGGFRVADMLSVLPRVTNKKLKNHSSYSYYLDELCKASRGEILQKNGSLNKYRYKFKSPLIRAFVGLKIYQHTNSTKVEA